MKCRAAEDEMQRALDAPLTLPERARLDAHLNACPACRRAWEDYRRLSHEMREWVGHPPPRETPPAQFTAQVLARLQARPDPSPVLTWPRLLAAGAFAVLLMVLSPDAAVWIAVPPHWETPWAGLPDLWAVPSGVVSRWAAFLLFPALALNTLFLLRARRKV